MSKKYITTDKAKILREGVEIEQDSINSELYFVTGWKSVYSFNDDAIETMLRLDELKEIQEPKWTDEDLEEIVGNVINRFIGQNTFDYSIHVDPDHKNWPIILKDEIEQFKQSK